MNNHEQKTPYRVGRWLPSDQSILDNWLKKLIEEVEAERDNTVLHPVVEELKDLIENDPEIYMFFHQMFDQIPDLPRFKKNPAGGVQVQNYQQMLLLINAIMTKAPEYNDTGLVGFPINAILDWSMGTVGGYAAFLNDKVNAQFKKVLNYWGEYLKSSASVYVLNDDPVSGWLGTSAMSAMPGCFVEEFVCEPSEPHFGFTSWDNFFTREFREGARPIAGVGDDSVIVNACESAPYNLMVDVKLRDTFWLKGQPYSLQYMMNNDPIAEQFVGGTIYQAFLSALSYHRWHSPVSGTIKKKCVVDGTYYSEARIVGYDESGPNESQGYITEVATRALIFIEADNPKIGLMCFMAVGMAEVSTCDITVNVGDHITKGEQLGMFHFGGSTHCLIFRPDVSLDFDLHGQTPGLNSSNIDINSRIAKVL